MAKNWRPRGTQVLHLVDLDGPETGQVNEAVVQRILRAVNIPVQLGGGIRDTEGVRRFLDMGVDRVIIGTAALKNRPGSNADNTGSGSSSPSMR